MSEVDAGRPTKNWIKVAAFTVAVGFVFWSVAQPDDPEPASGDTGAQAEAWTACKDAVTEQLSNPASADFSLLSTQIERDGDDYSIAGTLTATNDFGAEKTIAFDCDVSGGQATASVVEP